MAAYGRNLVNSMDAAEDCYSQSTYTDTSALDIIGWQFAVKTSAQSDIDETGLSTAFDALNIESDASAWVTIELLHIGNAQWQPTYAIYQGMINFQDGALVALQNYGPQWQISNHKVSVTEITPLRKWSDLLFLCMLKYIDANNLVEDKVKINHFFRVAL